MRSLVDGAVPVSGVLDARGTPFLFRGGHVSRKLRRVRSGPPRTLSVMVSREDLGSWLGGGPQPAGGARGSRLGLPDAGPGSMASTVRRVVALGLDWAAATAVSYLFANGNSWATLAIFAL